jgi:hypothetical protein
MEPQVDYERELTLAAFRSPEQADEAFRRLEAMGVSATEITRVPLGPGRYQTEDIALEEENAGVRKGTVIGAPIGAAVGLGIAIVVPEARAAVLAGMAAAGAFGGGIIGGFVGSIFRARFDDDAAAMIEMPADNAAVLLAVHTSGGMDAQTGRARAALHSAGAIGFLDPSIYDPEVLVSVGRRR